MAAVLGEHGARGPAIALVWDGTGAGHDGTAWGGELLVGDLRSARRLATFRPIPLAGADRAIREPWRLALALLQDAFDGDPPLEALGLFRHVSRDARDRVFGVLGRPGLCAPAHGVGRYFDAVGSLLLQRPTATYSGELAQALNFLATGRPAAAYPFELDDIRSPWQIDLRPAVRALVDDVLDSSPIASVADRFHATLVAAGEMAVRAGLLAEPAVREAGRGRARVALAGGCFQNAMLLDGLLQRLGRDLDVLRPVELPPGDGGLAFGQALVADAVARSGAAASEES
jgi:hydrogenase maturation protein HypF